MTVLIYTKAIFYCALLLGAALLGYRWEEDE